MKQKNGTRRRQWQFIAFFLLITGLFCTSISVSAGFLNPYVRVQFYRGYILWHPDSQQIVFWARLDTEEVFAISDTGQQLQPVTSGEVTFPKNSENNLYIPYETRAKLEEKYGTIAGYVILPEIDRLVLITSESIDGFIIPIYTEQLHLLNATSYENIATIDARRLIDLKITTRSTAHMFIMGAALALISVGIFLRFGYPQSFGILRVLAFVMMFLACYLCSCISYLNSWSSF
jgi:hypothetical protein